MLKYPLFSVFICLVVFSCQKQSNLNGKSFLFFSADTLSFDTVFTTVGSVTQQVKIVNTNNQGINISSINLMGGSTSPFIINIDGTPGSSASNLNIPANDSLYIL